MNYESSYESGLKPFQPDLKRGIWSRPHDFFYAGLSLAFRFDTLTIAWYFINHSTSQVLASLPWYLILLVFYIIPLQVIQMFLGQFSSSGFITAFRLSPIFKGIGYLSLALNVCVLCYFTLFATIPLVYMIASLNPVLPWSCEGYRSWSHLIHENDQINLCDMKLSNLSDFSIPEEEIPVNNLENVLDNITFHNHQIPSAMYFAVSFFRDGNIFNEEELNFSMSWQLIMATIFIWLIIAFFYYKSQTIELYGCLVRYSMWVLLLLLLLCLLQFSFLEGAGTAYRNMFTITLENFLEGLTIAPIYTITAFGPGWGILISLSSHNSFKTNIFCYSWCIGIGQIVILITLNIIEILTEHYFSVITKDNYYSTLGYHWVLYLSTGSALANTFWPNFWCFLFYGMLVLAAILLMIIQVYSILTSVFDEFVILRNRKLEFGLSFILGVALCSLYFASNDGIVFLSVLTSDAANAQIILTLFLILMVCWIYGRVRFQQDIKFMVGQQLAAFRVHILRFLVPLCFLLMLLLYVMVSFYEHSTGSWIVHGISISLLFVPWLFIPGFMGYSMWRVTGESFKIRLRKCCRPSDWYPVASQHRQAYEESMGNQDITHQLDEVTDDQHVC